MPPVVFFLAGLFAFRLFGLFILLPILALYGQQFSDYSPIKVAWALGIYGLTQALLQIPAGLLSDRFGRKPMVFIGLMVFGLGSLAAAQATTLSALIAGRALQGAGVISSSVLAWVADITPFERRSRAMATIGMGVGLSFIVAMSTGPWLAAHIGVPGVLKMTMVLAWVCAVAVLFLPSVKPVIDSESELLLGDLRQVVADGQLWRLNGQIALLHAMMTATFLAVPLLLKQQLKVPLAVHGWIYLAVLLVSFLMMLPLLIMGEKRSQLKRVVVVALMMMLSSGLVALMSFQQLALSILVIALLLFFAGFNLLEAIYPSWVTKIAPPGSKGTAMGVYSASQFLGAFIGSLAAGVAMHYWHTSGVFITVCLLALCGLILTVGLYSPGQFKRYRFACDEGDSVAAALAQIEGIKAARYRPLQKSLYLLVDNRQLSFEQVTKRVAQLQDKG